MANNAIETVMGGVVLAVAGGFLYFAYDNSNVKPIEGYQISAAFSNITGINTGSDVRIGGIKIGAVEKMELDPKTYQAVAVMRIGQDVKLPKDSSAAVQSSGLLGDKFVSISPGGDDLNLADGGKITYTQPSVSLEEMIGKFAFSGGGVDQKGSEAPSAPATDSLLSDTPAVEEMPVEKPEEKAVTKPAAKAEARPKPAAEKVPEAPAIKAIEAVKPDPELAVPKPAAAVSPVVKDAVTDAPSQ